MVLPDLKLNHETVTLSAHELIQIHASTFDASHLQAIHEITPTSSLQSFCLFLDDQIHQGSKLTLNNRSQTMVSLLSIIEIHGPRYTNKFPIWYILFLIDSISKKFNYVILNYINSVKFDPHSTFNKKGLKNNS